MNSSSSFDATCAFARLAFIGLLVANGLGVHQFSNACALGLFFAIVGIACAYGSQLLTTNQLVLEETEHALEHQHDLQASREAAAFANEWAVRLQWASIACGAVSAILFVAGVLP